MYLHSTGPYSHPNGGSFFLRPVSADFKSKPAYLYTTVKKKLEMFSLLLQSRSAIIPFKCSNHLNYTKNLIKPLNRFHKLSYRIFLIFGTSE
jgi:hypothetical protein